MQIISLSSKNAKVHGIKKNYENYIEIFLTVPLVFLRIKYILITSLNLKFILIFGVSLNYKRFYSITLMNSLPTLLELHSVYCL